MIERFARFALICAVVTLCATPSLAQTREAPKPKRVDIEITEKGFTPASVAVEANVPIELVFTRRTDKTCATEVAIPSLKIKKALPLNEPVAIALTPEKDEINFACGMNMLKGKLVVK